MLREALQYLVGLSEPKIFKLPADELSWCDKNLNPVQGPCPPALECSTLSSVVKYVGSVAPIDGYSGATGFLQISDSFKSEVYLQIEGPRDVRLYRKVVLGRRQLLLKSECETYSSWRWGQWMSTEVMLIDIRQAFSDNDELRKLVTILSGIVAEKDETIKDNGVSQSVQVRQGIKIETKVIPELFNLTLNDWWPELPPIEQKCFLRVRNGAQGVTCALFALVDPAREQSMMRAVEVYLTNLLPYVPILV